MRIFFFALALACVAVSVSAQDGRDDPAAAARVHLGPLAIDPKIAVSNVGVDTNVFNQWDEPKKDYTATVTPGANAWLRIGRSLLTARANVAYVYFRQYSQERSVNADVSGRYEVNLFHVRPYVIASYLNTRERPGFEIDVRARRFARAYGAGADVIFAERVIVGVRARRQETSYAADAVFLGTYLRQAFDRREDSAQLSFRYKVTPLLTLVLEGDAERARFTYMSGRNSDGIRVMPGIEFDAFAIVQGSAYAGLRKLDMLGPNVPDYQGPVASVDLGYTLPTATRLAVQASRDVDYSFDPSWPYYLLTGFTATVTQRIRGPFDARARFGRQLLDYPRIGQLSFTRGRRDTVRLYGGGAGYRLGPSTRLGVDVDYYRRTSQIMTRDYKGFRIGTSLTYGY